MIRKFDLLIALYIFGVVTAELMGAKTFTVATIGSFHLASSVAIFLMPLLFTAIDVVVEVQGAQRARSIVYCGVLCAGLLIAYTTLATALPPTPVFAHTAAAYNQVFRSGARIAAASLTAFAVSELLNVLVFAKLRQRLHSRALWLRNNAANFSSQFADSAVFLALAFYSIHISAAANLGFLISLLIPYWLLRCAMSVVETPLVYLGVNWLRGGQS